MEIVKAPLSPNGSLIDYINLEDAPLVPSSVPSATLDLPCADDPLPATDWLARIFDADAFARFVQEEYYPRLKLLPFVRQILYYRNAYEILAAYLLKHGFRRMTNFLFGRTLFLVNYETEEVIILRGSTLEGYLRSENRTALLNFFNAAGIWIYNAAGIKEPCLRNLVARRGRVGETAFLDVFRVGERSVEFYGDPEYAATNSAKILHDPYIRDVADGGGFVVVNLQSLTALQDVESEAVPVELEKMYIEKLQRLRIENEFVILKVYPASDLPYPVYFFDGERMRSSFEAVSNIGGDE